MQLVTVSSVSLQFTLWFTEMATSVDKLELCKLMSVVIVTVFDYVLINNKHYKRFSGAFPCVWKKNQLECNNDEKTNNICTWNTDEWASASVISRSGSSVERKYTKTTLEVFLLTNDLAFNWKIMVILTSFCNNLGFFFDSHSYKTSNDLIHRFTFFIFGGQLVYLTPTPANIWNY